MTISCPSERATKGASYCTNTEVLYLLNVYRYTIIHHNAVNSIAFDLTFCIPMVMTFLYIICIHYRLNCSLHIIGYRYNFLFFISLIADGPHHYHPACGHKGDSHLSPVHALQFFYRDASSALLQLVNQWLNFTYSRSHAFRYERKNTNPTLVRIELTTSVLADVQLTY